MSDTSALIAVFKSLKNYVKTCILVQNAASFCGCNPYMSINVN